VAYHETAFGGRPEQAVAQYLGDSCTQHIPDTSATNVLTTPAKHAHSEP
jgi:hypothetical protein